LENETIINTLLGFCFAEGYEDGDLDGKRRQICIRLKREFVVDGELSWFMMED
jgi:hypothetical protein